MRNCARIELVFVQIAELDPRATKQAHNVAQNPGGMRCFLLGRGEAHEKRHAHELVDQAADAKIPRQKRIFERGHLRGHGNDGRDHLIDLPGIEHGLSTAWQIEPFGPACSCPFRKR